MIYSLIDLESGIIHMIIFLLNFALNILSLHILFSQCLHYKAIVNEGLNGQYHDQSWNMVIVKSPGECGKTVS